MKTARGLARLALCLGTSLLFVAPGIADEPPTCGGLILHGSPDDLAATPRPKLEIEQLAVLLSGKVVAPAATYDRLVADEQQLAALFPQQASSLFVDGTIDFKTIRIDFAPGAFASVQGGTYTAWDCLNDWYGVAQISTVEALTGVVDLVLDGTYDTRLLALDYATLDGVEAASEIGGASIENRGACVFEQGDVHHISLLDPFHAVGDCGLAGCAFTTEPGRLPVLRLRRALDACYVSAFTRTSPLDVALSPDPPLANEPVTLEIDGIVATCGVNLESVQTNPTTGVIDVLVNASFGCLGPPDEFSIDVPLGPLSAGSHLAAVHVRSGGEEEPVTRALRWIEPKSEGETIASCGSGGLGATLLVPYFEVDLAHAGGRTTLLSIGSASAEIQHVRAVLWTDRGYPSLGFTFDLGPDALATINLRDVFLNGQFPLAPSLLAPPPSPECDASLSDAERADLVAKHLGEPASDGQCYAAPAEEADVVTGWITVDVVNSATTDDCSAVRFPGDPGYFGSTGSGLAANRNVLWGDVIYVSTSDDSAQGVRAVAIPADGRLGEGDPTFYSGWVDSSGADGRLPLGRLYRSRFLNGGPLATSSELLVWTEGTGKDRSATTCGSGTVDAERLVQLAADLRAENGAPGDTRVFPLDDRRIRRLALGEAPLSTDLDFGQLDVGAFMSCGLCEFVNGDERTPLQTWIIPVLRAEGRFSVATDAARLDADCP